MLQLVCGLGWMLFEALDYGCKREEQNLLSPDLEQMIDLMTSVTGKLSHLHISILICIFLLRLGVTSCLNRLLITSNCSGIARVLLWNDCVYRTSSCCFVDIFFGPQKNGHDQFSSNRWLPWLPLKLMMANGGSFSTVSFPVNLFYQNVLQEHRTENCQLHFQLITVFIN